MTVQDAFNQFRAERMREGVSRYHELATERVSLKDLVRAYNRWIITTERKGKKIPLETFTVLCEEAFGDSRGKHVYAYVRVFLDEEDVEDFDREHKEAEDAVLLSVNSSVQSNPIINPCTDAVPSDRMADYILNSENKMALVRGLIEDKRCLSSEIDELEKKVEALEKYERHTNAFIYNLIKRQGDAYQKATPPH